MNENRSINDERKNLESILYGYYIKYDKMHELVSNAFANHNATNTIDIYIDAFDMLKQIYGKPIYSDKKYVIVSSIINLIAHMRQFFRRYYRVWTRIYIVYANNTTNNHKQFYSNFGDDSYMNTIDFNKNNEVIESQLEMIKILVAYINDAYLVKKKTMFPMFVYDNIIKNPSNNAIIITKNKYAYQIPALTNAVLFRPKKYMGTDNSFAVYGNNTLFQYYSNVVNAKSLEYLSIINPQHLSLLMALTGNSQCNMKAVVSSTVAIRIISEAIKNNKILNAHISDMKFVYDSITDISKYISYYQELASRYSTVDLIYQHLLYTNMPESLDYSWMVNFNDPSTIQDINNRYFYDNPLDLNSL